MILQDNLYINFNWADFWCSSSFGVTWPTNLGPLQKILPLTRSWLAVSHGAYLDIFLKVNVSLWVKLPVLCRCVTLFTTFDDAIPSGSHSWKFFGVFWLNSVRWWARCECAGPAIEPVQGRWTDSSQHWHRAVTCSLFQRCSTAELLWGWAAADRRVQQVTHSADICSSFSRFLVRTTWSTLMLFEIRLGFHFISQNTGYLKQHEK